MSNEETLKPNKIDPNETYHEQVNKIQPYKMKGSESKPNYYPANEAKPGYGDPETIGNFSTTVNKRAEVPPHANYNNKTGARPKTPTLRKCAFCSEQHNTLLQLPRVRKDDKQTMVRPFYPKHLGVVLSGDFPAYSSANLL